MARTDSFRRQHAELAALATEIRGRLTADEIARDARGVRMALARFGGKLRMHARMENEALYPELMAHPDADVRAKARALLDEVSSLYTMFDGIEQRWSSTDLVASRPREFILDVLSCFEALGRRMSVENATLYPLADSVR